MKKKLFLFRAGMAGVLFAVTVATSSAVYAATPADGGSSGSAKNNVCIGIGLTDSGGKCGDNGAQLTASISAAINILSLAVGIAAVVMLIAAGLKFVTAGGEANKIAGAKNSIIYALIGVIVVALAQFVVRFVLTQVKP